MLIVSFDIGILNLAVCVYSIDKVIIWRVISLFDKCPTYLPMDKMAESVYLNMDVLMGEIKIYTEEDIDFVLIESQPTTGKMKSIQNLIFGYFYNLKHYENIVKNIMLVSACTKLKRYKAMVEVASKNRNGQENYSTESGAKQKSSGRKKKKSFKNNSEAYFQNKAMSEELCLYTIQKNETLLNIYLSCLKKDDMADCFNQLVEWCKKKKIDIII
jgi:hypothetical protein